MHSIESKPPREEAYTTLKVRPPDLPGHGHTLRLKIDTGASGNTLPLRTFKQIYGEDVRAQKKLKKNYRRLSAYSGHQIPCLGTIDILCQHRESGWVNAKFYVVDVPGPAVVGLPTCELLNLVTVNVDTVIERNENRRGNARGTGIKELKKISTSAELKAAYPDQFDKIGNFSGTVKLFLKEDAEPFIDPPRKCSIHIKDKLKAELDKMVGQGVIRMWKSIQIGAPV